MLTKEIKQYFVVFEVLLYGIIIELCRYAQAKNLYADPHIKNFTIKNEKLALVICIP